MPNTINVQISIRSSISFMIIAVLGTAMTIFLMFKIDQAVDEIDKISNLPQQLELKRDLGDPVQ